MDDTTYSKQPAAFSQEGGSWKIVLPATWPWPMNSWRTAGGWMAVTELEIKFSPLWFKFSKTILHLVDSSYPKHLFELQDIQWCNGVVWIIVMFLSAIWTLILTAPINCREFIQTCLDDETNSSTSWMAWGWVHFFLFWWATLLRSLLVKRKKNIRKCLSHLKYFFCFPNNFHSKKHRYEASGLWRHQCCLIGVIKANMWQTAHWSAAQMLFTL